MKGVTKTGFEYEIDDERLDNMELIDALAAADNGNPLAISQVCLLLLGEKCRKDLYNHLRTEEGNVPIEAVSNALLDIINNSKETKN